MDIDGIQAHGIGAADITKLKANGFYTVAVRINPYMEVQLTSELTMVSPVRPRRHSPDTVEDQGFQRDQGREDQGSHPEVPGMLSSLNMSHMKPF